MQAGSRKSAIKEFDKLVDSVDRRAHVPKGFAFWSYKMQLTWLRQHQSKTPKGKPAAKPHA